MHWRLGLDDGWVGWIDGWSERTQRYSTRYSTYKSVVLFFGPEFCMKSRLSVESPALAVVGKEDAEDTATIIVKVSTGEVVRGRERGKGRKVVLRYVRIKREKEEHTAGRSNDGR